MERVPRREWVRPGCCLASIAHAIFIARHPDLSHEQSWDGLSYNIQDSCGSRGTISFTNGEFVGACFYQPSHGETKASLNDYFAGAPEGLRSLALCTTLQYLLQDRGGGQVAPVITTAFWGSSENRYVQCAGSWENAFRNGACLFERQFLPEADAIEAWSLELGLSMQEKEFVARVYKRRATDWAANLFLTPPEAQFLGTISRDNEATSACNEMLSAIRIYVP